MRLVWAGGPGAVAFGVPGRVKIKKKKIMFHSKYTGVRKQCLQKISSSMSYFSLNVL